MSPVRSVAEKCGFRLLPKSTTQVANLSAHPSAEQHALINQSIPGDAVAKGLVRWGRPAAARAQRGNGRKAFG